MTVIQSKIPIQPAYNFAGFTSCFFYGGHAQIKLRGLFEMYLRLLLGFHFQHFLDRYCGTL